MKILPVALLMLFMLCLSAECYFSGNRKVYGDKPFDNISYTSKPSQSKSNSTKKLKSLILHGHSHDDHPIWIHIKVVKLLIGAILLFSFVSIYKIYEEILALKRTHLASKYSNVFKFDPESHSVQDLEDRLIFTSGKAQPLEPARDPILRLSDEAKFFKLRREVCIYNFLKDKWELLKDYSEKDLTSVDNDFLCYEQKDNLIKISFEDTNFLFPNLTTKNFEGKVQLNSINLSPAQLRAMYSNETPIKNIIHINIPTRIVPYSDNHPSEEESQLLGFSKRIEDGETIFIESLGEDKRSKMRIKYFGYYCEYFSILAEVKNSSFKTCRIPFDYEKQLEEDMSRSVNRSSDMIIDPNINCDVFNILMCLCLSGPPTYTYNYYEFNDFNIINPTSINWVYEEQLTLREVVNIKHFMTWTRIFMNRLFFFGLFIVIFFLFWELVFVLGNLISLTEETQLKNFALLALCVTTCLQILIIIYSNVSIYLKNIVNLCLCCGAAMFVIILIVKEIIYIL